MSQPNKIILHVDIDAFYVSVETVRNPSLKGKPVVVGADPEEGKGRGVVVSCSYEARKFGLRSGMPIAQAFRLCPQAVYLRPDFGLYESVSEKVMSTLRQFSDAFEQVSIDEAFLDVSKRVRTAGEAKELAFRVKEAVKKEHSLTCSIGIGPNKSSAKIASDMNKPDGLTAVPFEDVEGFLAPLPVSVIPGVGRKTQSFLKERGIETIEQLQRIEGRQLVSWFGKNGVWLWGVIHGQENTEVRQHEIPKSLSVERTFKQDVLDFHRVYREASEASSELIRRLNLAQLAYRVAGIKIRFSGFETHTREKKLISHTDSEEALKETVESLLKEFEGSGKAVRLVGVRVSDLKLTRARVSSLDHWIAQRV
jgi:DNA polymerase IV (DinB-like DNA polymerase)